MKHQNEPKHDKFFTHIFCHIPSCMHEFKTDHIYLVIKLGSYTFSIHWWVILLARSSFKFILTFRHDYNHQHFLFFSFFFSLKNFSRPPPKGLPWVIDQTRGLLNYVEKQCSKAVYTPELKYVCIAGR